MAPRPWTPGKSAQAIPSGSTGVERLISSGTADQRLEALIQAQAHSRDQAPEVVEFEQARHMPLQELTRLISSIDAAAIFKEPLDALTAYRLLVHQIRSSRLQHLIVPKFEEWHELQSRKAFQAHLMRVARDHSRPSVQGATRTGRPFRPRRPVGTNCAG